MPPPILQICKVGHCSCPFFSHLSFHGRCPILASPRRCAFVASSIVIVARRRWQQGDGGKARRGRWRGYRRGEERSRGEANPWEGNERADIGAKSSFCSLSIRPSGFLQFSKDGYGYDLNIPHPIKQAH